MSPATPTAPPEEWLQHAPAARDTLTIGPPLLEGTRIIHVVSDHETGGYLRLGPREAFVLGQLDGSRTLEEIGSAYAERFARRLNASHWQQLLTLFGRHALLQPADPTLIEAGRARALAARQDSGHNPLLYRVPIPGAAQLVQVVGPRLTWLLHPVLVLVLTAAGVGASVWLIDDWRDLVQAAGDSPQRWTAALMAILITWVLIAAHELGHGIACLRYGGRPTELGIMWRVPFVSPYCKVDDVVTFPNRGQRVMTAFAGVYVNLAAQPVLLLLWTQTDPGPWWEAVLVYVILGNSACIVVNLLPVLQLDGYHMLEHATGSIALQRETVRFVAGAVKERSFAQQEYQSRAKWTYSSYALLAAFILGPAIATALGSWYVTMADLWNPAVAIAILLAEILLFIALLRWGYLWQQRRAAAASSAPGAPSGPPDSST